VPRLKLKRLRVRSLRTRFGIAVAVLMILALWLFGTYVYITVEHNLRRSLDDSLEVSASQAAATVTPSGSSLILGESTPGSNSELEPLLLENYTVKYLDASGKQLGGFGPMLGYPVDLRKLQSAKNGEDQFSIVSEPKTDRDYREYTVAVDSPNGTPAGYVQVLHDMQSVSEALESLLAALLLGGAVVTLAGGLAAYFLARRALAPIDTITKTARRISGHDLSARLGLPVGDDEVGRLASTFDEMLQRLDDSFQRERRFTADASHELRTPLAAMEAILDVVRAEPREPVQYVEALDDLAHETARLRALVDDLLRLARGGSEATSFEKVDLAVLMEDVVDARRPLAEGKDLSLDCAVEKDLTISGDTDSLIRLFVNLLDNALKFTEHGGVKVTARAAGETAVVDVIDTGVGIPASDLDTIFERFSRGDSSRTTPGSGLGLALARQIAEAHGGTLTVASAEGEGSTFTVTLPRVTA
jgi:signal transduction histidine kinase